MVEVYFYVPAEKVENIIECGMKLSEWHQREVKINGENKKCISTLLNPRDDIASYKSQNCMCIKLEVNPKYCYIADGFLYRMGMEKPEIREMYEKSIIPVGKYIFGKYRMPECLVTCTILGDSIGVLDGKFDSLILYSNSEDLYFNNILDRFKEEHDDFNDAAMYYLLNALVETDEIEKLEDPERGLAVFFKKNSGEIFTVKVPDISKYI